MSISIPYTAEVCWQAFTVRSGFIEISDDLIEDCRGDSLCEPYSYGYLTMMARIAVTEQIDQVEATDKVEYNLMSADVDVKYDDVVAIVTSYLESLPPRQIPGQIDIFGSEEP